MDTSRADRFIRNKHAKFNVEDALAKLREARRLLVSAGATKAADRVRLAISSTKGALRNAELREVRAEGEGR